MDDLASDQRTPGRRTASHLAQSDLRRRVKRLALPAEAVPRVTRFVEREVEQAIQDRVARTFTLDDVQKLSEDEALLEGLKKLRQDRERAAAIRKSGLADLKPDQLERVLEAARGSR